MASQLSVFFFLFCQKNECFFYFIIFLLFFIEDEAKEKISHDP